MLDIELLRQKAREGTLTKEDARLCVAALRGTREMAQAPQAKTPRKAKEPVDVAGILAALKASK